MRQSVEEREPSPSGRRNVRRAFTILEMLVVLGVVALLVALVLPAVQAARESARRAQCGNNLRQLSLACANHHASRGHLPTGGWGFAWRFDPLRGAGDRQPGGWAGALLPHLEQEALLDAAKTDRPGERAAAMAVAQTAGLEIFNCPSRPDGTTGRARPGYPPINAPNVAVVGTSDYAANAGSVVVENQWGPPSLEAGDRPGPAPWWTGDDEVDGVVFQRSAVRIAQIRDGASNTYLLAEKYVSVAGYGTGADLGHDQSLLSGVDLDTVRWTAAPPRPDGDEIGRSLSQRFGSAHRDGFRAAFADGSLRSISYGIDRETHRRLGSRADGEVVEGF